MKGRKSRPRGPGLGCGSQSSPREFVQRWLAWGVSDPERGGPGDLPSLGERPTKAGSDEELNHAEARKGLLVSPEGDGADRDKPRTEG